MTNNLKTVIEGRIEALAKAETVTKVELAAASRELLHYVPDTNDIGMVNRLMAVLTRNNYRVAALFFAAFLPWKFDDEAGMFAGKVKGEQKIANKLAAAKAFLAKEENNIWTWAEREVKIEARTKNYQAQIAQLVTRALNDEKQSISASAVIAGVILGGIKMDDLMAAIDTAAKVKESEEKKANDNKPADETGAVPATA